MNYPANIRHWTKGDIVIHDADAKRDDMLMVVIGYTRDGLVKTQYRDRRHRRTVFTNALRYLHDPALFDIPTPPQNEE